MIKIDEILDSSEKIFMYLPSYVFDVDHVAKIRSKLPITVLEKKIPQNYRIKCDLTFFAEKSHPNPDFSQLAMKNSK